MKQIKLTPDAKNSYKIGIDEIVGLKDAMLSVMRPVQAVIKNKIYWSDVNLETAEYRRRDGFIPHSHNCGGIQITEVIPKCEESSFDFLTFGECDLYNDPDYADSCGPNGSGCQCDNEGHLSAKLAVFLKFEGIDDTGALNFYLILHGGNQDAPYFRTSTDVFEAEFSCKSVAGLNRAASKHIAKLINILTNRAV